MAQIFSSSTNGKHGEKAEFFVQEQLRRAFRERHDTIIHAQFPLVTQQIRVPDFLVLDPQLGLVVIEVKGLLLAQITSVAGDRWRVRNYYDRTEIFPLSQARDAMNLLLDQIPAARPPARIAIALPYIARNDWLRAGHPIHDAGGILFRDDLMSAALPDRIAALPAIGLSRVEEDWFPRWRQRLAGTLREELPPYGAPRKGDIARTLLDPYVAMRDRQLQGDAIDLPNGPFRVRGIAGSGKTTLLAQCAAWMHYNNPSARIGFVYHTRSLFDHCFGLVRHSLEKLAASRGSRVLEVRNEGKLAIEGSEGAIRIFHSWGGRDRCGFYSFLCSRHGCKAKDLDWAMAAFRKKFGQKAGGSDALALLCAELLERFHGRMEPYFDALFLDEAQDLISSNEALRDENDREPFFWLAYQSLKSCDPRNPSQRRLIFAYDEAQSLGTLRIPTAKQLFGEELGQLFQGGRARNRIMRCCYRNPKPILMAAHSLGMGLFRRGGAIQGLGSDEWRAIGYEVDGSLREGHVATLLRSDENSPNPVPVKWNADTITVSAYDSAEQEFNALRNNILHDIGEHRLNPSRDILVVDLRHNARAVKKILERKDARGKFLKCHVAGERPGERDIFWVDGHVTISDIWRAKGNEAPMVYIIGVETLGHAKGTPEIQERNKFFVALTRAQAWCTISGVEYSEGSKELFEEIRTVVGMVQSSSSALQFISKRDRNFRALDHEEQSELALM